MCVPNVVVAGPSRVRPRDNRGNTNSASGEVHAANGEKRKAGATAAPASLTSRSLEAYCLRPQVGYASTELMDVICV